MTVKRVRLDAETVALVERYREHLLSTQGIALDFAQACKVLLKVGASVKAAPAPAAPMVR